MARSRTLLTYIQRGAHSGTGTPAETGCHMGCEWCTEEDGTGRQVKGTWLVDPPNKLMLLL